MRTRKKAIFAGVNLNERNDESNKPFEETIIKLEKALEKGEKEGTFEFNAALFEELWEIKEWHGMNIDEIIDAESEKSERTEYTYIGTATVQISEHEETEGL